MPARFRFALLLPLIGPTLVVPIDKWHHHEDCDHDHEGCVLCTAAASIVPDSRPPAPLPIPSFVCLFLPEPDAPAGVVKLKPVQARAPPLTQFAA